MLSEHYRGMLQKQIRYSGNVRLGGAARAAQIGKEKCVRLQPGQPQRARAAVVYR